MRIFLKLFFTVFILSYLSIFDYLGDRDTLWAILFNLIFLGLSIRQVYLSNRDQETKNQRHLFIFLTLFIILATSFTIISF